MAPQRRRVGYISVQSGLVWLGDPGYVISGDSSHGFQLWSDFRQSHAEAEYDCVSEPAGGGVGFALGTLYGQGWYPVFVEWETNYHGERRPSRVVIDFNPSDKD